jgi:hypothetical protein
VDLKFAEWQQKYGNSWFVKGPLKDQLDRPLPLFDKKPIVTLRSMLEHKDMGYTFDTIC